MTRPEGTIELATTLASTTCVSAKMSPIRMPSRSLQTIYASNAMHGNAHEQQHEPAYAAEPEEERHKAKAALRSTDSR